MRGPRPTAWVGAASSAEFQAARFGIGSTETRRKWIRRERWWAGEGAASHFQGSTMSCRSGTVQAGGPESIVKSGRGRG